MKNKFCSKCGAKLNKATSLCPQCDKQQLEQIASEDMSGNQVEKKLKKAIKITVALLILVSVVCIAVFTFSLVDGKNLVRGRVCIDVETVEQLKQEYKQRQDSTSGKKDKQNTTKTDATQSTAPDVSQVDYTKVLVEFENTQNPKNIETTTIDDEGNFELYLPDGIYDFTIYYDDEEIYTEEDVKIDRDKNLDIAGISSTETKTEKSTENKKETKETKATEPTLSDADRVLKDYLVKNNWVLSYVADQGSGANPKGSLKSPVDTYGTIIRETKGKLIFKEDFTFSADFGSIVAKGVYKVQDSEVEVVYDLIKTIDNSNEIINNNVRKPLITGKIPLESDVLYPTIWFEACGYTNYYLINGSVDKKTSNTSETKKAETQPPTQKPTQEKYEDIPDGALIYNGHSYYVFEEDMSTWEQAKQFCEDKGGYLVIIDDTKENEVVYEYMIKSGYESAYLGLTDKETEGVWKTSKGKKATYFSFADGEPNNERGKEHYAMFYYKSPEYMWNDGDFTNGTVNDAPVFICEWDYIG